MIRIGDFARLAQVSVVTLRHYDELGLLTPISVDPFTGYRYYTTEQLPKLNRILALKDFGFKLDQIENALANGLTPAQLRGMLKLKRAEVEQHLAEEQDRLSRIEARLRQIESEDTMPNYDVVLKTMPAQLVAARRATIPTNDQVPAYLGPAFDETYAYVKTQGVKDTGPCFSIWHTSADTYANEDAEAIVPIEKALPSTDRIQIYELPATQVASVVHHGKFEDFTQGHTALLKWIEANGYTIAGPFREIYIQHNKHDLGNSTTEIQFPVKKG